MGISTTALRYSIMNDFIDSFDTSSYYVIGSNINSSTVSTNTERSAREFLEKAIFGKKVALSDVRFMVNRYIWQPNKVYTQYDDSLEFADSEFFVIVEPETEAGDYRVFKCISNNYGAVSVDKPVYNINLNVQNYKLQTADGYIWKYMYSVSSTDAQFFGTATLFPVIPDQNVISDSKLGIDNITVENPSQNFGYESQSGIVFSVRSVEEYAGARTIFLTSIGFNQIRGYYSGYTFFTTSSNGVTSRKYTIVDSGVSTTDQRPYVIVSGYVENDITDPSVTTWTFSITPAVEIVGNGTGASALAVVVDGRITSVRMLATGQNYTRAIARIRPPNFGFNPGAGDVSCKLRAVLSPSSVYIEPSGHGGNPAYELNSKHVLITAQFDSGDSATIPTSNTYSKVGLVRDPVFSSNTTPELFDARLQVEVSSAAQIFPGDVVSQTSTNFQGIVHSVDNINNIIYITEFFGPYSDQSETTSFFLSNITPLDDEQPLTTPAGRVEIVNNGVTYPSYTFNTGEVLYLSDFSPIERQSTLSEQYKFIISF